jgi:clan AA aspartic protease (TIGR02281 family)
MHRILLLMICLTFFLPAIVGADFYRWQDQNGNWHCTDDYNKVPPRYRDRVKQEVLPEQPVETPTVVSTGRKPGDIAENKSKKKSVVAVPKTYKIKYTNENNSLMVNVTINGNHTFPFVLDTGASSVSLSRKTAEELGYNPDDILPRMFVSTANGVTSCRLVRLSSVQIGDACVHDVVALIHGEDELGEGGLLGLTFLNEFDWSNDTMNDTLTLREFKNSPSEEVYGGHNEKWWRKKFDDAKKDVKNIEKQMQTIEEMRPITVNDKQEKERVLKILEADLEFYKQELDILDRKAGRYMVPRYWR